MAKTELPAKQAPARPATVVGRMVLYYLKGDTQPQAAVVQRVHDPVEGEPMRVDLFVFGVPSQGLTQCNAQRVPCYSGPPERFKEWCEFIA